MLILVSLFFFCRKQVCNLNLMTLRYYTVFLFVSIPAKSILEIVYIHFQVSINNALEVYEKKEGISYEISHEMPVWHIFIVFTYYWKLHLYAVSYLHVPVNPVVFVIVIFINLFIMYLSCHTHHNLPSRHSPEAKQILHYLALIRSIEIWSSNFRKSNIKSLQKNDIPLALWDI